MSLPICVAAGARRRSSSKKLKMKSTWSCFAAAAPRRGAQARRGHRRGAGRTSADRDAPNRASDQGRGFSARNESPSTAYGGDHDPSVGGAVEQLVPRRATTSGSCRRRSRSATCRPGRETAARRLRRARFVRRVREPPSVRREHRLALRRTDCSETPWRCRASSPTPRRLPPAGSSDRSPSAGSTAPRTPGTCRSGATSRAVCGFGLSVRRCGVARPIGPLPVQVRRRSCPRDPTRTRSVGHPASRPGFCRRPGSNVRRVSVSRAHS